MSRSAALGRALAARFLEVIVDEAQDCNPIDLQILRWFREHGLAVTVVADPNQAIYGFRHGDPTNLRELASSYDPANRLNLTGNFRSSPAICALAATLRDRVAPDDSVGETATIREPVHILEYHGVSVPAAIGRKFFQLMETSGIDSGRYRRRARSQDGMASLRIRRRIGRGWRFKCREHS